LRQISGMTAGTDRFTLDYGDRKAISWVATTGGLDSGDMRDLMDRQRRAPLPGSPCTARGPTKIGLGPLTAPMEG